MPTRVSSGGGVGGHRTRAGCVPLLLHHVAVLRPHRVHRVHLQLGCLGLQLRRLRLGLLASIATMGWHQLRGGPQREDIPAEEPRRSTIEATLPSPPMCIGWRGGGPLVLGSVIEIHALLFLHMHCLSLAHC